MAAKAAATSRKQAMSASRFMSRVVGLMPDWVRLRRAAWRSGGECGINCFVNVRQGGIVAAAAAVDKADHFVAVHAFGGELGGELLDSGHGSRVGVQDWLPAVP